MKYSTKLSDTIHILIFIALGDDEQLSSTKIAESIKTNPAYVRQLMATLKNAGIVVNTQGHANAALAKSADKINMYDIYRAVEGDKPLLHLDTDTNPDCGIGINIQFAIGDFYHEIQNMVDEKMKSITLQDIIDRYYFKIILLIGIILNLPWVTQWQTETAPIRKVKNHFKIECVIGITDDDKHGCSLIADHIQFHFVIRHDFSKLLNIKW